MSQSNQSARQTAFGMVSVGLGALLFLFGLVTWQVGRISQPQNTRSQAEATSVEVSLGNVPNSVSPGQKVTLDVLLNTNQTQVTGVQVSGSISNLNQYGLQLETTEVSGMSSVVQQLTPAGEQTQFFLVHLANPTEPYQYSTNGQLVSIGRIVFYPTQTVTFSVGLNAEKSLATSFGQSTIIPNLVGAQTYTITVQSDGATSPDDDSDDSDDESSKKSCDENCATDTECKSSMICHKGRCRNPQEPEDDQCAPDRGLNRGCNQYCADSNECDDEFTCYYNYCRNPRNIENTECAEPRPTPSPRLVQTGATTGTTTGSTGTGGTGTTGSGSTGFGSVTVSPSPSSSVSPSPRLSPTPLATRSASSSPRVSPFASPRTSPRVIEPLETEVGQGDVDDLQSELAVREEQRGPSAFTRILQVLAVVFGLGVLAAVGIIWMQNRQA